MFNYRRNETYIISNCQFLSIGINNPCGEVCWTRSARWTLSWCWGGKPQTFMTNIRETAHMLASISATWRPAMWHLALLCQWVYVSLKPYQKSYTYILIWNTKLSLEHVCLPFMEYNGCVSTLWFVRYSSSFCWKLKGKLILNNIVGTYTMLTQRFMIYIYWLLVRANIFAQVGNSRYTTSKIHLVPLTNNFKQR